MDVPVGLSEAVDGFPGDALGGVGRVEEYGEGVEYGGWNLLMLWEGNL